MNYETKTRLTLLLDFYGAMLTDRQREISSLSFNEDLSLREISEITGITPQGVREALLKSEKNLFEFEENLGLYERFNQRKEYINNILTELEKFKEVHPDSADETDKIKKLVENMPN